MHVTVDSSELRRFAAAMGAYPQQLQRHAVDVVRTGATKVKQQLQAEASKSRYFSGIGGDINFDLVEDDGGIQAEIGIERNLGKKHQGPLAGIAYFGGSRGGGGTLPDPQGALDAEGPYLVNFLEDLMQEMFPT